MRKKAESLNKLESKFNSRLEMLENEGLVAAPMHLTDVKQKSAKDRKSLKFMKKHHKKMKSKLNTQAAKDVFVSQILRQKHAKLNAKILVV